jgi:hypothetical protein
MTLSGNWGTLVWGRNRWSEGLQYTAHIAINEVFVVSKDIITVSLPSLVAADSNFYSTANYVVTNMSGGKNGIVLQVLPVKDNATNKIFLQVMDLVGGDGYRISISGLKTSGGYDVELSIMRWIMHKTKVDSSMDHLPGMYSTDLNSVMRYILEAVMISDEKIGGDY